VHADYGAVAMPCRIQDQDGKGKLRHESNLLEALSPRTSPTVGEYCSGRHGMLPCSS
jgi:hypothetical protein